MALIQPFQMELWVAFTATSVCSLTFVVFYAVLYPKAEFNSDEFLLPDATLSHMVKECRKLFSAFYVVKRVTKSHVFLW
jgi:hypothetical protein